MKRYHAQKKAVGVSLFPFLAVLICTMGALIVLLVLVVQMARVDASERPPQPPDDAALEKENYQWRLGLLQQERQTLAEDAQRNLAELSHLEQHIRELEKRWKQLVAEATDLKQRVGTGPGDVTATRNELARVQAAITTAKQELDAARRHAAQQPPVYCIVPYDGPNGTHRQPVYLECTQQGIVVQPDGIILRQRDLEGPLGAGNPLDAVLRAVRKYQGELQGTTTSNAYPLLVVRPDGAESYVLARAAMRVWDDEFGYELIDAQKQLQFPPVDPRRAELLRKVVDDARSRQAILVAAMPSRYQQRGSESGYVAAPAVVAKHLVATGLHHAAAGPVGLAVVEMHATSMAEQLKPICPMRIRNHSSRLADLYVRVLPAETKRPISASRPIRWPNNAGVIGDCRKPTMGVPALFDRFAWRAWKID